MVRALRLLSDDEVESKTKRAFAYKGISMPLTMMAALDKDAARIDAIWRREIRLPKSA